MSILKKLFNFKNKIIDRLKLKSTKIESIFTYCYLNNSWNSPVSVSGTGSDLKQTEKIRDELPRLFRELNTKTFLDIPCGDFYWMKNVNLDELDYTGADIVKKLVSINQKKYSNINRQFKYLDITSDNLPKSDLILCRDCFVHLSFNDIFKALSKITKSNSVYLLTTTFIENKINKDIVTGEWRPINLEITPFNFPKPEKIIIEECSENGGFYNDKVLGLWVIKDLLNVI